MTSLEHDIKHSAFILLHYSFKVPYLICFNCTFREHTTKEREKNKNKNLLGSIVWFSRLRFVAAKLAAEALLCCSSMYDEHKNQTF